MPSHVPLESTATMRRDPESGASRSAFGSGMQLGHTCLQKMEISVL